MLGLLSRCRLFGSVDFKREMSFCLSIYEYLCYNRLFLARSFGPTSANGQQKGYHRLAVTACASTRVCEDFTYPHIAALPPPHPPTHHHTKHDLWFLQNCTYIFIIVDFYQIFHLQYCYIKLMRKSNRCLVQVLNRTETRRISIKRGFASVGNVRSF